MRPTPLSLLSALLCLSALPAALAEETAAQPELVARVKEIIEVDVFIHHISDFTNAAEATGLKLVKLNEYWHEADENKPPRLVSFIFEKA